MIIEGRKIRFGDKVLQIIKEQPGVTDREIINALKGKTAHQSQVYQQTTHFAHTGVLLRMKRPDGKIGNYLSGAELPAVAENKAQSLARSKVGHSDALGEDALKEHLRVWLEERTWKTTVAWGKKPGVDILAEKAEYCWIIEAKGIGSSDPMRVNYFLAILGTTLQRMRDGKNKYSIALPDVQQYRNLWGRLPALAKERTGITALFVDHTGHVTELH